MGEQLVEDGDTVAVGAVIARDRGGRRGCRRSAAEARPADAAPANPAGPGETPLPKDDAPTRRADEERRRT